MGLDPSISAFAAASGATDLTALNNLAKYLRSQSLLSSVRCFPFKSAQNAGSGSTVYGWGDLTANNCTLVNSPTWGAGGVDFAAASNQYAHASDFLDEQTITVFIRKSGTVGAAITYLASQWDFAANERAWALVSGGSTADASKLRIQRSSDGSSTNSESLESPTGQVTTSDKCYVGQWIDGGSSAAWVNKTSQSLTLVSGSAQTTQFNSADSVLINATGVVGGVAALSDGTYTTAMFVRGSLTTLQRETITDLINAL